MLFLVFLIVYFCDANPKKLCVHYMSCCGIHSVQSVENFLSESY